MSELEMFHKFCSGCGLCHSVESVKLERDEKGFYKPILKNSDLSFCREVCPAGGAILENGCEGIWGDYIDVFYGWSTSSTIRQKASSGGVLTALCSYLLEQNLVDGVIQTVASNENIYETETVISRTPEEIKKCMGSRYSISAPLKGIRDLLNKNERYAFVGKPCDISALRLYMEKDVGIKKQIKYLFSFFCAGMPSVHAQQNLLGALGVSELSQCRSLQYRGNGWPGDTTLTKTDGSISTMSYTDSWGRILGRDIQTYCRVCIDGIGLAADIVCGDAWYINNQEPDFSNKDGRNVIFTRTSIGDDLLKDAAHAGYIAIQSEQNILEELRFTQKYQYERRASMASMMKAFDILHLDRPTYNRKYMKKLSKYISLKMRLRRAVGTAKRIKQGKI